MHDMRQMTALGRSIEDESFAIVDREVGPHQHPPNHWEVVRRVIHATADFEFRDLVDFHPDAVASGCAALRRGCKVITDVQMIAVGLSPERLSAYGVSTRCDINRADVIARAQANNSTRAIEAMREAASQGELEGAIVAIGNAPTALLEVVRLAQRADTGHGRPALVIGVPVGFVSAAESKEKLRESSLSWIVTRGRKGGSTIAVAIVHAILRLCAEGKA